MTPKLVAKISATKFGFVPDWWWLVYRCIYASLEINELTNGPNSLIMHISGGLTPYCAILSIDYKVIPFFQVSLV